MQKGMYDGLISVIVPVYNAEKYLNKCVSSILEQKYQNLEVLLIDDGSTDNSYNICKHYEELDTRVRVIAKLNEGVSHTRNRGIKEAKGKYIAFIDADDYIDKQYFSDMYERLLSAEKTIAMCKFNIVKCTGKIEEFKENLEGYNFGCDNKRMEFYRKLIETSEIFGSCWRVLIPTKLLRGELTYFPHCKLAEDKLFLISVLENCDAIEVVDKPMYYYREVEDSLSRKKYKDNFLEDRVIYLEELEKRLIGRVSQEQKKELIEFSCCNVKIQTYFNAMLSEQPKKQIKIINDNTYLKKKISPMTKKRWKRTLSHNQKLVYYLLKLRLFGILSLIRKSRI